MAVNVTLVYLLDFVIGRAFLVRFLLFAISTAWSVYGKHGIINWKSRELIYNSSGNDFLATSLILKPDDGPINIPYHLIPLGLYYITIAGLILYHTHLPSYLVPVVQAPTVAPQVQSTGGGA